MRTPASDGQRVFSVQALTGALTVVFLLTPRLPLYADPIPLTAGTVEVNTGVRGARIFLQGDGFFIRTGGDEDFVTQLTFCRPCISPVVNMNGAWIPTFAPIADVLFNGVHYDQVYLGFFGTDLRFMTPDVTLTGTAPQTVTVPFTFSGQFDAFADFSLETHLFTASVVGTGKARAQFLVVPDSQPPLYGITLLPGKDFDLEYNFSAIPEPGTLLLMGSGFLGLVARRYRRHRT